MHLRFESLVEPGEWIEFKYDTILDTMRFLMPDTNWLPIGVSLNEIRSVYNKSEWKEIAVSTTQKEEGTHVRCDKLDNTWDWIEIKDTDILGMVWYRSNFDDWQTAKATWPEIWSLYPESKWKRTYLSSTQMRVDPNDLLEKSCDCGALKAKTTHANWCSTNG